LIRYLATKEITLTATPMDLRAAVSDAADEERVSGDHLRYFAQAHGDGVEWSEAPTAPGADGAWHSLPDGAGVILAVPATGAQRPWFRSTEADTKIVVSGANAPAGG